MKSFEPKFKLLLALVVVVSILLSSVGASFAASPMSAPAAPSAEETCKVLPPAGSTGKDSYIKQEKQDERRGGDSELRVKGETSKLMRSLLQFDLSAVGMPAGAQITRATLSLYVKGASGGALPINAHGLTASWNEAEVTWKARDKAAGLNWSAPGGDYGGIVSTTTVDDTKSVWRTWDLTSLATAWQNNSASNMGVILEASGKKAEKIFKSSDDGTASQRPRLEICFSSGLTLEPDNHGTGVAGLTRTYSHVLKVGSDATSVTFSALSSQGWAVRLYRDVNGNGAKDGGDSQIMAPLALAANATVNLLAEIDVPLQVLLGATDVTTVRATATNGATDTAVNTTQVGGLVSLQPSNSSLAVAGATLFYKHTLVNNGDTQDCFALTTTSSQGWPRKLWAVQNGINAYEITTPVCLNPGQSFDMHLQVSVPAGAAAGMTDTATVQAASSVRPGETATATDSTVVFVNDPPVIDGKYDDIYRISPDAEEVCYTAQNGTLFGKLATFYQPSGNAVYMVLAIDKDFVDNTYGANAVGWSGGHTFGNLDGSDHAQFLGYNANETLVLDFKLDYIDGKSGTPSAYASLGVSGGEGQVSTGSASHILAWGTSEEYNLNRTGYCVGGDCAVGGVNVLVDSPATDAFYTPNQDYPDWVFDVIYEVKIDKAAFGAAGFGSLEVPYIHASPSKLGTNTIYAEPGVCPGEIGDRVWYDENHDGVQDPLETGLSGVQIKLYRDGGDGAFNAATDTLVETQTTSSGGLYLFQDLAPDDYFVDVVDATVPAGYVSTTYNDPTPVISLAEGESYLTADFGYVEAFPDIQISKELVTPEPIYLGQEVEFSIHIMNTGFTTISTLPLVDFYDTTVLDYLGATPASVDLVDDGVINWTDLTASFGRDLAPQQSFTVNVRFLTTGITTGGLMAASASGDAFAASAAAAPAAVTAEPVVDGLLDAGYAFAKRFTLADADVPGNLYTYAGASQCYYAFVEDRAFNSNVYSNPDDRAYMTLDGWMRTHTYSDLDNSDKGTYTISYTGGTRTVILDLVEYANGSYRSGFTGFDNSSATPTPAGSVGATSTAWNFNNSGWTSQAHSPSYNYNSTSGQYWEWNIIYELSIPKSQLGGGCGTVTMMSAHNSPSKYASGTAMIGDLVWDDANRNRVRDAGEAGLPGVTVNLLQNGVVVRSTQTEAGPSGYYIFSNLAAGAYTVRVDETTLPAGYTSTTNNNPMSLSVTSGGQNLTADFGYASGTASIGDRVYYDLNGDGGLDNDGEPGLNGIVVNLYRNACPASGVPYRTLTTSGNGGYDFTMLPAGAYCVDVDEGSLLASLSLTTANEPLTVNLSENQDYNLADFGYEVSEPDKTCDVASVFNALDNSGASVPPVSDEECIEIRAAASIGDYVWNDINGNGIQDEDPLYGMDGVVVTLYRDNGDQVCNGSDTFVATQSTAGGGYYTFASLAPGDYCVDVEPLGGYELISGPESGPDPMLVSVTGNQAYTDADFGYAGRGNITGFVYYDWNENGVLDINEDIIPGVEVCLYRDANGDGVMDPGAANLGCQDTDIGGAYNFQDHVAGTYLVVQTQPSGLDTTTPNTLAVELIVIGPSGSSNDNNFGEIVFSKIGDFIFLDPNGNGVQDPGETQGVPGIPVTVTALSSGEVLVTASNQQGYYLVDGLLPGTYSVQTPVSWPGLARTTPAPRTITLGVAETRLDMDFGYISPTAVLMTSFTASATKTGVLVQWATQQEQNQLGFRVYRSSSVNGVYKAVSGLIAAANDPSGASYQWLDSSVKVGDAYWYKIESVPDGQMFGPVSSQPSEPSLGLKLFLPRMNRLHR